MMVPVSLPGYPLASLAHHLRTEAVTMIRRNGPVPRSDSLATATSVHLGDPRNSTRLAVQ